MKPLFSVVIANYNYGRFLESAIRSVLSQGMGENCELIICDAASTDGSVEVIRKYEKKIAWWCSEKDGGQSAAFNKGFSRATGRFLTWLNADDVFLPGALMAIKREIDKHPDGRWFAGGSVWGDKDLRLKRCFRAHRFSRLRADIGQLMVGGPSSFFEHSLLDEVGDVDESFHYAMDVELWYRFYKIAKQTYYRTSNYVWAYRIHEESKMSGPTLDPDSEISRRKRAQLSAERKLLCERYGFGRTDLLSRIGKLFSLSPCDWLCAHFDTVRLKNQPVTVAGEIV